MDFEIKAGDSISPADQVRALAAAKIDAVIATMEKISRQPEKSVHSARKDLKKLRGLVRLTRDSMGSANYKNANKAYRNAGRELAEYRDQVVRLQIIEDLRSTHHDPSLDAALKTAADRLEKAHEATATPGALEKSAEKVIRRLKKARGRLDDWPLEEFEGFQIFRDGLSRVYARCCDGLTNSLSSPTVENLHDWRKRCKYLRYQMKLLRSCWPEILDPYEEELHHLTNHLGDDHDLAVLRETLQADLEEVLERPALTTLNELITNRHREHVDAVWPLARRLFAEPPEGFVRRFEVYWRAAA